MLYVDKSSLRYLATKPEAEGFRDQDFLLPEVESLRVQSFVASLPSREEPDINCE